MMQILGASLTGIESSGVDKDKYHDWIELMLSAFNKERVFFCQYPSTTAKLGFVHKSGGMYRSHESLADLK